MRTTDTGPGPTNSGARARSRWAEEPRAGFARIAVGHLLVGLGAFAGAFGAVAWIAPLALASPLQAVAGALVFALLPGLVGLSLTLVGLELLAPRRRPFVPDELLVALAWDGATREDVARGLGLSAPDELRYVERRLDCLVLEDALDLVLTDDGALVYRRPIKAVYGAWEPSPLERRAWEAWQSRAITVLH